MIDNPQIGGKCWIVTDIWETLCAVPVMIVDLGEAGHGIVCRWQVAECHSEYYGDLKPEDLYSTQEAARAAIREGKDAPEPWARRKGGEDHADK